MAFLTAALLAIGALTAAGGAVMSYENSQKASHAQDQQLNAQTAIAKQQNDQLNLDAARQRREIARQSMMTRATALSNATNQGAAYGSSSGSAGGAASIFNQGGAATLASEQNQGIGNTIFGLNAQVTQFGSEAAADMGRASFGNSISGFGSMLMANSTQFGKVGSYAFNSMKSGWG